MTRRAVFLDRDGTLNEERGYLRKVEDLVLMPGVAEAIKRFKAAGYLCILTTNQSGVARGFYGEDHIRALHERLQKLLHDEADTELDLILYCPHLPPREDRPELSGPYVKACQCRKPNTGMIQKALEVYPDIDLKQSYVIGDKASDVEFGKNAGCKTVLLKTGYGERVLAGKYQTLKHQPDVVCESIGECPGKIG